MMHKMAAAGALVLTLAWRCSRARRRTAATP